MVDPWAVGVVTITASISNSQRPGRLIFWAVKWIVAGLLLAAFIQAIPVMLHARGRGLSPGVLLSSMIAFQIVMLCATFRCAQLVGVNRNWRDGLGIGPYRNTWLLFGLLAIVIGYDAIVSAYFITRPAPHWVYGTPSLDAAFAYGAPVIRPMLLAVLILLCPVAEELFFRGWLWTGLRRWWPPAPVMIVTALPWLAIHVIQDVRAPIFLLPLAVTCSLARHFCGGVRASIAVHMTNNYCIAWLLLWLYL